MTTGTYVVPQALVKLRRARPGVAIALELGNTSQIAQAAANDAIDIGIVEGTVDVAELVVTPFAEDTLVCVSSVDDRVRGPVNAAALTDRTLLLREPGSGSREATLDALRDVRTTFVHTLEIGDPQAIAVAAMSGLGIAWLSRLTVAGFQDKLTIIDVADVKITRTFSYLRRRDRAPTPAVSAFLDALRN